MGLDVETPDPPDLTNRPLPAVLDPAVVGEAPADRRREELEAVLREGAWTEAFEEWTAYTDLSEPEYAAVADTGFLQDLDLFWNPVEERLRVEVPAPPDSLTADGNLASRARTELSDLGDVLLDVLEDDVIDWSEEGPGADSWTDETFADQRPPED